MESLETIYSLKKFVVSLGTANYIGSPNITLSPNRDMFVWPLISFCHIQNLNLRYQSPIFNVLFRNLYIKNNIFFSHSGTQPFHNFFSKTLGVGSLLYKHVYKGKG